MIDVFKVGVSINMASNGSQVLGTILRDLLGIERGATAAESSLNRVKIAAMGAGAAIAGIAGLDAIWKLVDAGKELNHQLELMANRGGEFASQLAQIKDRASAVSMSVPTSVPSQNVRTMGELGGQVGVDNAMQLAPMAAKFQALHEGGEEDFQSMLKVIELRGKLWKKDANGQEILGPDGKPQIDMASVQTEMDAAHKAMAAQGGQLTVPMLLQMAKQGSIAVGQQSADTFYNKEGEVAVNMGASRAGTALASLASQFQGGTMTQKTAEEMEKLGYLKKGEWRAERGGHIVVDAAARDRLGSAVADPFAFAKDLVARMEKLGMNSDQQTAELTSLFGRQTVQRLMSDIIKNGPSFDRISTNAGTAKGIDDSYQNLINNDLDTNLKAFAASFKTFSEELSLLCGPTVINLLHGMTDAMHWLTEEMVKHPTVAKDMLALAAGLAALLALVGIAAFAAAMIGALGLVPALAGAVALTSGILALAAAVFGLPKVLQQITDFVDGLLGINPHPLNGANPKGNVGAAGSGAAGADSSGNAAPAAPANGHSGSNLHDQQYEISHPHGRASPPVHLSSYIMLDGKQIAKVVSTHQADAMSRPPSSRTGFDDRMSSYGPSQMVRT